MHIRLITEGNYPVVTGGVTRWCELLISGLSHHDWSVTALGVDPDPSIVTAAPVEYVTPCDTTLGSSRPGRTSTLPAVVARHLFAADGDGDPAAFAAALAECRCETGLLARMRTPGTRRAVRAALAEVLAGSAGANPMPSPEVLEAGVASTFEVVAIASRPAPRAELHLSAAAGRAVVPAVVAKLTHGTPFVLVEHGVYVREAYLRTASPSVPPGLRVLVRRAATNLARLGYAYATRVVGVSQSNTRWSIALGADPGRTTLIPNGVHVPEVAPPLPGAGTVGMISRIDPFKGVDLFVRMAAAVAAQDEAARFVHIGPVEAEHLAYYERCRSMVHAAELDDRFEFRGPVADPTQALGSMDVVVLPSRSEGLPYVLLEAMAAGRPVVASSVGGVPDALHGAGLLTDPDDVDGLATAVLGLLALPDWAAETGLAARRAVEASYSLRRMLERMDSVLRATAAQLEAVS